MSGEVILHGVPESGSGHLGDGAFAVPESEPIEEVPYFNGQRYQADLLRVDLHPVTDFEVYFKTPQDLITFSMGASAQIECAYNSSRVRNRTIHRGRMHFHPKGTEIYCASGPDTETHVLAVSVPDEVREAVDAEMGALTPWTELNLETQQSRWIGEAFEQFMLNGQWGGRLAVESMATLAFVEALRGLTAVKEASPGDVHPVLTGRVRTRVLDYIEARLAEDMRLADLASVACLSPYHFSRCFKASIGKSPMAYISERRVERAKHLLIDRDVCLARIALDCGFSSQSHFTATFRKLTGMTPGGFRKCNVL